MNSHVFVPGINNSSFDYDARFERMMNVLTAMAAELKAVRESIGRIHDEVHSEFDYRARRPWQDVIPDEKPQHADLRSPKRIYPHSEESDDYFLEDIKW